MNHTLRSYRMIALITLSILLASTRTPARSAPAGVAVCGAINANTTWTLANSPYDICAGAATVNSGVTLTIQPGVVVQFDAGVGSKLYVVGTLIAHGTSAQPITFTGVSTIAGSWGGLNVDGSLITPAVLSLDNVTLNYGGTSGSFGAAIYADKASLTITHSQIENSTGNGIYTTQNTSFEVHNTSFIGNGQNALQLNSAHTDLSMSDLSANGNGTDGVRLAGTISMPGQRHWSDPGIPYYVDGPVSNLPGDVLTIDPGSNLLFAGAGYVSVGGHLDALGTPNLPITMTGQTKTPGIWRGIFVNGGSYQAVANLDYVTVEYGGNDIHGANIEVGNGKLVAHHSTIRNSQKDGIRFDSNAGGSILQSQITGNSLYGIFNSVITRAVLATNDWWGDPSGPHSDLAQCPVGSGDKVTAGVLFSPVLSSANASVPFPLSNAPSITLTPRRWFAPADGVTRIYFDITLRDGNGTPISGRQVRISTNLGVKADGGITDVNGKTLAYLTSTGTGDAIVSASLDAGTSCETALSPESKVTFTTPINTTDLFPNSPAPYFDGNISLSPLPVLTGVTETVTARLTNPLTTTVTVNVSFAYVQSSIGLAFGGSIKDYTVQVIPANSSMMFSAQFKPPVSGHYCVQVSYEITGIGPARLSSPLARQLKPFNFNAQQSTTSGPQKEADLSKTRNSLKAVNRFVDRAYSPNPFAVPLAVANQGIAWDLNNAEKISNALSGDPPRQDYTLIDLPHKLELPPIQPGNGLSAARANALNALDDALAQANAYGVASSTALDRYGGASAAGDLQWASTQSGVMLEYNQLMGTELITAALDIDNLLGVAASEGVTSVVISASDVISMQQKLATGFSQQEINDAHAVGLTDADIEVIRQSILAANPQDLAGDLIPRMQDIRDSIYTLGRVLQAPSVFAPGFSVTGGLLAAPAAGNTMAQVYNTTTTFPLANPLGVTSLINVSARRIDLPADWSVDISPAQVNLSPGQQTTVTVSVIAGSPVPQGSEPRVAVEAYAGTQMLGGIVFDILVPRYAPFDGHLHLYMPLLRR